MTDAKMALTICAALALRPRLTRADAEAARQLVRLGALRPDLGDLRPGSRAVLRCVAPLVAAWGGDDPNAVDDAHAALRRALIDLFDGRVARMTDPANGAGRKGGGS